MAEHQLPKLTVRVRFSSPAPRTKAQVRDMIPTQAVILVDAVRSPWAIYGPLPRPGRYAGRAVVGVVVALVVIVGRLRHRLAERLRDRPGPLHSSHAGRSTRRPGCRDPSAPSGPAGSSRSPPRACSPCDGDRGSADPTRLPWLPPMASPPAC